MTKCLVTKLQKILSIERPVYLNRLVLAGSKKGATDDDAFFRCTTLSKVISAHLQGTNISNGSNDVFGSGYKDGQNNLLELGPADDISFLQFGGCFNINGEQLGQLVNMKTFMCVNSSHTANYFNIKIEDLARCTKLTDLSQSYGMQQTPFENFVNLTRGYGRTSGKINCLLTPGCTYGGNYDIVTSVNLCWDETYEWLEGLTNNTVITKKTMPASVIQKRTSSGGAWYGKTIKYVEDL